MSGASQLLHVKLGAGGYLSFRMPTCSLPGLVLCGHQQKGALTAARVKIFNAVLVSYKEIYLFCWTCMLYQECLQD